MKQTLLAIAVVLFCSNTVVAEGPVVQTVHGPVMGETVDNVDVFNKIPFAAPPTGDRRFAAPVPPSNWTEVYDATPQPNICMQLKLVLDFALGDEDCLYMHVYKPHTESDELLPVMVWLFGGGYVLGDGYEFGWYDGKNLVEKHDVIIVAPNYRVGPAGFMALDELRDEDPNHSTGNMALLDQRLALEWVQQNIKNFGGDPKQVTIFGESAGGFSVCWHMVSPGSAGLFHGAIMESGSCNSAQFFQSYYRAQAFSREYAAAVGCNYTGDALLSCLRSKPYVELMKSLLSWLDPNWPYSDIADHPFNANAKKLGLPQEQVPKIIPGLAPVMPWGPAIDGTDYALPDFPYDMIKIGRFNKVPIVAGTNQNEGKLLEPLISFVAPHENTFNDTVIRVLAKAFNMYDPKKIAEVTPAILSQYQPSQWGSDFDAESAIITDWFFTCHTRKAMRAFAEYVPTYLYHFSYDCKHWIDCSLLGDYHTIELSFVWDNQWPIFVHDFNDDDKQIADAMGYYWTTFAKTLKPNAPGDPYHDWPEYTPSSYSSLEIKLPFDTIDDLDASICSFWEHIEAIIGPPIN